MTQPLGGGRPLPSLTPGRPGDNRQRPPGRPGTRPAGTGGAGLDPEDQSAFDVMTAMLKQWGLESLAQVVYDFLIEGYTQDQISILIQDSEPYKKRFAGNEARRRAGLPALDPAAYLAVEGSYRQIMSTAGLPVGFYDQPDDFAAWIGADVSPQEIQSRVGLAVDAAQTVDSGTRQAFMDWYGVGENELAAFFLDRERALPAIERIARGVQLGGGLIREGLNIDRDRAEFLAGYLGDGQAVDAAGAIAEATRAGTRLGSIYGQDYGQADAENEVVLGSEEAKRKRRGLAAMEVGTFSSSSGVNSGSLKQPASKNI